MRTFLDHVCDAEVVKPAVGDDAGEAVAEGLIGESACGVVVLGGDGVAFVAGDGDEAAGVVLPGLGFAVAEGVRFGPVGVVVGAGDAVGAAVEAKGLGFGLGVGEVVVRGGGIAVGSRITYGSLTNFKSSFVLNNISSSVVCSMRCIFPFTSVMKYTACLSSPVLII